MTDTNDEVPPSREEHLAGAEGAVLRADDLIAGYLPGVNILNGADLFCQQGELVGIIGPNGAGKSTLLKALFGLVKVSSGAVQLRGDDVTNKRADALVTKGIGFVPQTNNVFPSLTVQENLEMASTSAPSRSASSSTSWADSSPPSSIAATSGPARCRAASDRWSRWVGR